MPRIPSADTGVAPLNPLCNGAALREIAREHPCFGGEAHYKFGRIHLPVSPRATSAAASACAPSTKTSSAPA